MECFIISPEDVSADHTRLILRSDEARHAARSLRMRVGESFIATDLAGMCYRCRIAGIEDEGKHELFVLSSIEEELPEHNEPSLDVELIQGILTQPSKFEEIVERCTEIGIKGFAPIMSERVERNNLKTDRLRKILRMACKQSHRARLPELAQTGDLESALGAAVSAKRMVVLLHEGAPTDLLLAALLGRSETNRVSIVVGPEGGFSDAEVDLARTKFEAAVVSLGPRRLRAETAAIAAAAIALGHKV